MKVENSLFNPAGPLSLDSKSSTGGGNFGAVLASYLAKRSLMEEEIATDSARDAGRAQRSAQRAATEPGTLAPSRKSTARPRPEKRQAASPADKEADEPREPAPASAERSAGTETAGKTGRNSERREEKPAEEAKAGQSAPAGGENAAVRQAAGETAAEAVAAQAQKPAGEVPGTPGTPAETLTAEQAAAFRALPESAQQQPVSDGFPLPAGPENAQAAGGTDFPSGGKNCIPAEKAPSWQEAMAEALQSETSTETSAETSTEISNAEGKLPAADTAPAEAKTTPTAMEAPGEGKAFPPGEARPAGPEAADVVAADQNAGETPSPQDKASAAGMVEETARSAETGEASTLPGPSTREKAAEPTAQPAVQDQPTTAVEAAEYSSGGHPDTAAGGNADQGLSHGRAAAQPAQGQEARAHTAKGAEPAFRNALGEAVGGNGSFETKSSASTGSPHEAAATLKAARLPGEEAFPAKATTPATRIVDMDFVSESKERLKVQLEWSRDGVKGMIVTESAQARSDLSGNMEDLRRRLEQAGVTVLDLDVAMAGQQGSGDRQVGTGSGDEGSASRGSHGQGGNARAGRPIPEVMLPETGLKLGASVSWIA